MKAAPPDQAASPKFNHSSVLDEVREWQHRALDLMYPIVIFDALRVKIRDADSRMVKNKAVYIALGVTREGDREVLGCDQACNFDPVAG